MYVYISPRVIWPRVWPRCGSFQLLPDSTKANPASLNDFCLENVGCPRSSLGAAAPPARPIHRRCYRAESESSLENGRALSPRHGN